MVTVDQGFDLEIVAKPAYIHPSPKTLIISNIRATNRGAVHVNPAIFPATTLSSQASPRKKAISVPDLVEANSVNAQKLNCSSKSSNFTQTPAQARIVPRNLLVERSGHEVLHEMHCATKPQKQFSNTANNEVSCSASKEQVPVGSAPAVHEKPTLPENFMQLSPRAKLKTIKQFLDGFDYKQTPGTHFNTHKLRPLARIMNIARMIIYSPQPIKCIEAVFVALYLTAGIGDCDRIPLSFKTSHFGQVYQHIVLLIRYGNKYGAFGISRHPDLMTKDIKYSSICHVVENYKKTYEEAEHLVLKIRVGLQVEHKVDSSNFICWRHLCLNPPLQSWEKCCEALESHLTKQTKLWNNWILTGKGADPRRKCLARKATLDNKLLRNVVGITSQTKFKGEKSSAVVNPKIVSEHVEERTCKNVTNEPIPKDVRQVPKTKKDKLCEKDNFQAKDKHLMKFHVLKNETSKFLRRVKLVDPKLISSKIFLKRDSNSLCGRMTKVSINLSHAKQSRSHRKTKGC